MMGMVMDDCVLKAGVHDRLVQDIEGIAAMSRVPVSMIRTSSVGVLGSGTTAYLKFFRKLRSEGKANVYLTGPLKKSPEKVMMAMGAALIRNFIDARVYPLQALLENTDPGDPTVMLVPNFQNSFIGKPLASHQLQKLYSLLLDRMVKDRVTILVIENMAQMSDQYGTGLSEFIEKNYTKIKE